jgi:N-acetyl-gamma-glutamyl-phosphate reductase
MYALPMQRAFVYGAGGYAGLELSKLLAAHGHAELAGLASDQLAGTPAPPALGKTSHHAFEPTAAMHARVGRDDLAFLAVPHAAAPAFAAELVERGAYVIDLSNAHRATRGYVYGLTSLFAAELAGARRVANPGCYATCVITALAPLVKRGWIDGDAIVSAASGVTGAGKGPDPALTLGEMYGEVRAYNILRHPHVAEIEAALARIAPAGGAPKVILTTHLLPVARGIFATATIRLAGARSAAELEQAYDDEYADDPFVSVCDAADRVSLRGVVGTNLCQVGVETDGRHAVITASLDNLLKGAAGQALECSNLMLGLPRTTGLELTRHA